jgi:hypothetical protein
LGKKVSRVFLASWSPSLGFGIKKSEVREDVSPGSSSCLIGTGVMCEAYEPSSSSYMVIKSMRKVGIPVPLDALANLH